MGSAGNPGGGAHLVGGPEAILLYVLVILVGAKVGGELASRLKQPPVAGEILVGVLLGPSLLGFLPAFDILDTANQFFAAEPLGSEGNLTIDDVDFAATKDLAVLALLAEIGVLVLLFEVGLESNLAEFRRVGWSAGLVGTFGVVFSLAIGWGASELFAQRIDWVITDTAISNPHLLHAFIGATLAATSVGITARVLSDMGRIRTRESQIILGAAVFDDVLGLIILAIVGGLVVDPAGLSLAGVARVFGLALGFFFAAILLGVLLAPRIINWVHTAFRTPYVHLGFALALMFAVSYLATWVGLAAIVGAFAAGLALSTSSHRHIIFEDLKPVGSLFVGFFFVILGARVDLTSVTRETLPLVLLVGGILTVAGILGKLLCGLGVLGGQANRYVVGVGMVPRGEVGLIFALFGLEHGLLSNWQYTTIIVVVLFTTLITPFWLKAVSGRFKEFVEERPDAARIKEAVEE